MKKMKKNKLAFVDVETTGIDPERHEIIELGLVLVEQNWDASGRPEFKILDQFEAKVKPERIHLADKTALRINGYNEADWALAWSLPEAMKAFAKKTKDAIMVAHNVAFDYSFLAKAFSSTGIENKMHYHKLDTISIAFAKLHLNESVDRFSLQFLCDHFGIVNKRAHSALSDASADFELFKRLMAL